VAPELLKDLYSIDYDFSIFKEDQADSSDPPEVEHILGDPAGRPPFRLIEDGQQVEKRRTR
jgi:hypothetical protein